MAIKAVSYYYCMFSQNTYSVFKMHVTGTQALERIVKHSTFLFDGPMIEKKKNIAVTRKAPVTIGYPCRHLKARFLDAEEIQLVEKYGEKVWWDNDGERFIAPEKEGEK